jgi:hypothetical protein
MFEAGALRLHVEDAITVNNPAWEAVAPCCCSPIRSQKSSTSFSREKNKVRAADDKDALEYRNLQRCRFLRRWGCSMPGGLLNPGVGEPKLA